MKSRLSKLKWLLRLIGWCVVGSAHADDPFTSTIQPLLESRCLGCHNPQDLKGGLSLVSRESLLRGGDSGSVVTPGKPDAGTLLDLIAVHDGKSAMPKGGPPLSEAEIVAIRDWIANGAPWPADVTLKPEVWWSLRPLGTASPPAFAELARTDGSPFVIRNPVDAFIAAQLAEQGLAPARDANRRILIRRATFDLTGLPPTPEEIDAFVSDPDPLAYERLIDRLLESPLYGERWARHWLDVVKYADTCGYDKDKLRRNAWPYRDYVIRSFNEDKPYARFVKEQLAGDVCYPDEPDGILGLGFIAAGPWDFIGHVEVSEDKIDGKLARSMDRDEMVASAMNTFCSATIQCARCHDHKFDPYTQQHYYGLQAVFAAVDRADRAYDLDRETRQQRDALEQTLRDTRRELRRLERSSTPDAEMSLRIEELRATHQTAEAALKKLPTGHLVYAATTEFPPQDNFRPTRGRPREVHVLDRGNVTEPGAVAQPQALPVVPGLPAELPLSETHSEGDRRAALAEWVIHHDHPLTWRSIVNRVWRHHFGAGLVGSLNDFGRMGQQPTHPGLLDWLATRFRDDGQSIKQLHRLIMTSSAYRQTSEHHPGNAEVDDTNRLLWRMERRRLSAEEIRDATLTVSGAMNLAMGGEGYFLFQLEKEEHSPHYEYQLFDPASTATHRRSVYRFVVRSQPDPYMTTLDCADSSQSTPQRTETVTALQALTLMNNRFNLYLCERFATRLRTECPTRAQQVRLGFELVTGRPPDEDETSRLLRFAEQHGLENLCRLLLNLNEFVYID